MKALRNSLGARIVVQLLVLGLVAGLAACSTSPVASDDPLVGHSNARSDDEILLAAVLDVFAEGGLAVRLLSEERGMVLTDWTAINREVRHRYVARVIRSNVGLVLTVDSEYERRELSGAAAQWVAAHDPYTVRDKRRDEQRMGESIQARFKALGGGKSR